MQSAIHNRFGSGSSKAFVGPPLRPEPARTLRRSNPASTSRLRSVLSLTLPRSRIPCRTNSSARALSVRPGCSRLSLHNASTAAESIAFDFPRSQRL
ncbi:MAG: hypothetical protein HS122_05735 [Opitutaceae bacterium]|nr:hypothetical protein [Opitutaceae bacterium]